jgi:3-methyl-2-oxobutanoate hydroxymethyltransferase
MPSPAPPGKPVRVPDLVKMKRQGEKITMLTAYDATMARLLDGAGIDILLVGDSLGMVVMGFATTVPVTLDMVLHHTGAVARAVTRALVVADMPFLTHQVTPTDTLRNAGRLIQEGGAAAVKIEGGRTALEATRRVTDAGIPVMGHLGLTPQSIHKVGGFKRQATSQKAADQLIQDAIALEREGAFAIVLESVPDAIAGEVSRAVSIPTIGIGAGPQCDGQVLVSYDLLGMFQEFVPAFVKQYVKLGPVITDAVRMYRDDVRAGRFPEAR